MNNATSEIAPFAVLADVVKDLRDRWLAELRDVERTPYSGQLLGALAAMITHCQHIDEYALALRNHDEPGYRAFQRALTEAAK